jgi:myo-inositol-1(or 4)-monophosphatase
MHEIDIEFCSELLTEVGANLYREFTLGERSRGVGEMFHRFHRVNDSATSKIKTALTKKFPHVRWLDAEFDPERYKTIQKGDYWLCDPIDGALNFLQGIPYWSLSLCFIHDGQPRLSFVFDPCQRELFHAVAGQGAFRNGKRMKVSDIRTLEESILATAYPTFVKEHEEDTIENAKDVNRMLPKSQAVRMMGTVSLQLAYVAAGKFDGYWERGFDMYDWWAGALLVSEAGGVVTDTSGNAFTWGSTEIIAANPVLHSQLQKNIKGLLE